MNVFQTPQNYITAYNLKDQTQRKNIFILYALGVALLMPLVEITKLLVIVETKEELIHLITSSFLDISIYLPHFIFILLFGFFVFNFLNKNKEKVRLIDTFVLILSTNILLLLLTVVANMIGFAFDSTLYIFGLIPVMLYGLYDFSKKINLNQNVSQTQITLMSVLFFIIFETILYYLNF